VDEYDRGVPRTAVESFIKHAGGGDFEKAAQYLDMRNLPRWMGKPDEQEMARQLKIVIDRGMWLDFDALSEDPKGHANDGLPAYRDTLGRIEMPDKTVDILLQHVPREDGIYIWKFSNRTIAEIPLLYEHYGYHPIEERLSEIFPDVVFLGWYIWQWVLLLIFAGLSYLLAVIVTLLLNLIWRSKESGLSQEVTKFIHGPLRFILWVVGLKWAGHWIGISTTMRGIVRAHTLLTFAFTWAAIRTADIFFSWWTERLLKSGSQAATVLLRPVRTMVRIVIVILGVLVWLDNIGFNISTLLAGMGVGGVAVALAAQDTLKNFIASILILLDKPYMIGERILVKGHDGVVEEIGLRSTDIENVGRRPHIRRSTTISIAYDTPLAKVEKEFTPTSLAIKMLYWYEPPKYWDFMAFNEKVNVQIMEEFEKEGIRLALPITEARLNVGDEKPLEDILGGEVDPEVKD
jgi:MscS family membrane protein